MSGILPLISTILVAVIGLAFTNQTDASRVHVSLYTAAATATVPLAHAAATGSSRSASPQMASSAPAPTVTSPAKRVDNMTVVGPPTIDPATIRRVLAEYNSPAVDEAEAIYELGRRYGIDPAFCLAFFIVESSAGTQGMATVTRSVGNIRATPGYVNYKGYRKYASWRDSIEDWYQLIARLYVGDWKLTTVEEIVPVYAPAEDSNDPARYINTVRSLVNGWRAAK